MCVAPTPGRTLANLLSAALPLSLERMRELREAMLPDSSWLTELEVAYSEIAEIKGDPTDASLDTVTLRSEVVPYLLAALQLDDALAILDFCMPEICDALHLPPGSNWRDFRGLIEASESECARHVKRIVARVGFEGGWPT